MSVLARPRIDSLQALRALAFLGIFTSHATWNTQMGAWGVSVFFVLSGFCLVYNYWDRVVDWSLGGCVRFATDRIGKLYSLHLLTMLLAVPFEFERSLGNGTTGCAYLFKKVILSITLLESWSADFWVYGSFNGVAWFLSASLFMYFCFPFCLQALRRICGRRGLMVALVLIYGLQVAASFLMRHSELSTYPDPCYWIAYTCPLMRMGDFLSGCAIGALFVCGRNSGPSTPGRNIAGASVLEVLVLGMILWSANVYENAASTAGVLWFRYACLWVPSSCALVYLFARRSGALVKILNCKTLKFLGDLSASMFLVHWLAIVYCGWFLVWLSNRLPNLELQNGLRYKVVMSLLALGTTVLVSCGWQTIQLYARKGSRNG